MVDNHAHRFGRIRPEKISSRYLQQRLHLGNNRHEMERNQIATRVLRTSLPRDANESACAANSSCEYCAHEPTCVCWLAFIRMSSCGGLESSRNPATSCVSSLKVISDKSCD